MQSNKEHTVKSMPSETPKKKSRLPYILAGVFAAAAIAAVIGLVANRNLPDRKDNEPEQQQAAATEEPSATPVATEEPPVWTAADDSESIDVTEEDIIDPKFIEEEGDEGAVTTRLLDTGIRHNGSNVSRVDFKAKASSTLKGSENNYDVKNLWDININTSWAEGKSGNGIGEKITFFSKKKQGVRGIAILPGCLKAEDLFYKNSMPTKLSVQINDETWEIDCFNVYPRFNHADLEDSMIYLDFGELIETNKCTVKVKEVRNGTDSDDMHISEMFLYW